jgi:hypothetical protein
VNRVHVRVEHLRTKLFAQRAKDNEVQLAEACVKSLVIELKPLEVWVGRMSVQVREFVGRMSAEVREIVRRASLQRSKQIHCRCDAGVGVGEVWRQRRRWWW